MPNQPQPFAEESKEIKCRFEREGKSIADWARENGFYPNEVHRVLNGFSKAKRGRGHAIAVALGIKTNQ